MNSIKLVLFLLLSIQSCSEDPSKKNENTFTEEELELSQKVQTISEEIFKLPDYNKDTWTLVLMGDKESITKDLCNNSDNCAYSDSDFMRLSKILEKFNEATQILIIEANEYFSGRDVKVSDENNTIQETPLNQMNTDLGKHKLTLIKTSIIEVLHNNSPSYGLLYWLDKSNFALEAFSDGYYPWTTQNCYYTCSNWVAVPAKDFCEGYRVLLKQEEENENQGFINYLTADLDGFETFAWAIAAHECGLENKENNGNSMKLQYCSSTQNKNCTTGNGPIYDLFPSTFNTWLEQSDNAAKFSNLYNQLYQ